jgi:hypothetical protein
VATFAGCATLLGLDEDRQLGSSSGGAAAGGNGGGTAGSGGAGDARERYREFIELHDGVAYFPFEDETGAGAFANLLDTGRPAEKEEDIGQAAGVLGLAASFDGANHAFVLDHYDFAGTAGLSIELWLNTPAAMAGTQQVVAKRAINVDGYSVTIDSMQRVTFTRLRSGMSTNVRYVLDPEQDYGRFIHVVATFDDVHGSRLFVDADERGEPPSAGELELLGNAENFEIGGDAGLELTGLIDELALYDRALTPAEIAEHFEMVAEP